MCCAALRQIGACVSGLPGFCCGHICVDKPCQRQAAALGILSASTQSLPETCGGFVSTWRIRSSMQSTLFPITSNVDEHEAIDLFLHSSKAGLFYMDWNVICPCCAQITQSLRDLHSVESQSTCKLCFRKDKPSLDDAVQISFTLSPAVRSLRFHHPETLSLEDYTFKYLFEPTTTIVSGLAPFMDAFEYGKRHFSAFSPGEKITVETEVGVGALASYDLFGQQSFGLVASGG